MRPDPLDRKRLDGLPVWAQAIIESMAAEIADLRMSEDGLRQAAAFAIEGGGTLRVVRRPGSTHSMYVSVDEGSLSVAPVSDRRVEIRIEPGRRTAFEIGSEEIVIEAEPPPRRR